MSSALSTVANIALSNIPVVGPIIGEILGKALDKIPDPAERRRAADALSASLAQMDMIELQGQLEINKIEAANPSLFVSGGRPAALWLCNIVLALVAVAYLIWPPIAKLWGLPYLADPNETVLSLFVAIFMSLAGIRSFEKWVGVARHR